MKTPRQILLERHRAAQPKLDALRQRALTHLGSPGLSASVREPDSAGVVASLRALLRYLRWHLAGLSALWFIVALLNLDSSSVPAVAVAKKNTPSPRQILKAMREHRRLLFELIESPAATPSSSAPPLLWQPRSEVQLTTAMA
jgi:hypothetical protein